MRCKQLIFCVLSLVFLHNCKEKDAALTPPGSGALWVICEGNFQSGNAEIGSLDFDYNFTSDLFKKANGFPLGDVLQDIQEFDGSLYVILNNSGKLEKLDATTLKVQATGKGFNSPRKICFFDSGRAFVTDLYQDAIYEINLNDLSIQRTIPCSGWTESMVKLKDELLIVNIERQVLLQYNPSLNQFTDSLALPANPGDILLDKNHAIWLYCGGASGQHSALLKIDPKSLDIIQSFTAPVLKELFPKMVLNTSRDTLIILNSGIYQMSIDAAQFPASAFQSFDQKTLYGIGYNPANGDILVSENESFSAPSRIHVISSGGTMKKMNIEGGMVVSGFLSR